VEVEVVAALVAVYTSILAEVMVVVVMIVVFVAKERTAENVSKLSAELAGWHGPARTVWKDSTKAEASSVEDIIVVKESKSDRVCEMNVNGKKME
jgi:hypothetical protein